MSNFKMRRWGRAGGLLALSAAVTFSLVQAAYADNVIADLSASGDTTFAAGGSTTINYKITATGGDGESGCNASDSTPAVVVLNVPAGVTASPTSLTFSSCGTSQAVSFGSSTAGDYNVTANVHDSGAGSYNTNPAMFTLHVTQSTPTNTKPTVAVTGFTDGDSFEIGSEPTPGCTVTDAEDANPTAVPTVDRSALSHGLGTVTVTCDYTDLGLLAADTATATYTIVDTGDPTISHTLTPDTGPNGNGWYNEDVTVGFTCSDTGSGIQSCSSDTTLVEGEDQSVTGTAIDWAGNTATDTVTGINIDETAPTVSLVGGPATTYYFGDDPAAPTCDASDALSGVLSCVVTGGGTTVGSHTYTATATDLAGNTNTATLNYEVLAWTMKGFYQPVDMSGVWNTVKGGSTVPLKFEIFAGSTEKTDTSAVTSFTQQQVTCPGGTAVTDAIEITTTGGTNLRYDTTGGQFVQNWATPKKPGTCYVTTMTAQDGSTIKANFMLK